MPRTSKELHEIGADIEFWNKQAPKGFKVFVSGLLHLHNAEWRYLAVRC